MKKAINKSWKNVKTYWYLLIFIIIFEVFFLYAFGKIYSVTFIKIGAYLQAINQILAQNVGALNAGAGTDNIAGSLTEFNAAVSAVRNAIIFILGCLLVGWTVFEGAAWFFIQKMAGMKRTFFDFLWRFATVTIAGFAVFLGIIFASLLISSNIFSASIPLIGQESLRVITIVFVLALLYLMFAAYGVLDKKQFWKSFKFAAFKKIGTTGFAYLVLLLVMTLLYSLIIQVIKTDLLLGFILGLVILLPAFTVLRLYFIETIHHEK